MKKGLLYILIFVSAKSLFGQQTETYTQYVFNQFTLNPAIAGTAECADIKIGGKYQWIGIEKAPSTTFLSIHGALKQRKNAKSWHGVGLYIVEDKAGLFGRTQFNMAYAYHLRLSRKLTGSVGTYLGARNQKFHGFNSSPDPLLSNSISYFVFPDISIGGLIYSENTFVGLSAKQVLKRQNKDFRGNRIGENTKSIIQYYFTAGTRIKSNTYVYTYVPSIMLRYGYNAPLALDATLLIYGHENKLGVGVNLRMIESVGGIMELKLTKSIWLGYAYDFPISKIRKATSGSHEVILKIDPCRKSKDNFGGTHCPVF